jgi:hypothetical protein
MRAPRLIIAMVHVEGFSKLAIRSACFAEKGVNRVRAEYSQDISAAIVVCLSRKASAWAFLLPVLICPGVLKPGGTGRASRALTLSGGRRR